MKNRIAFYVGIALTLLAMIVALTLPGDPPDTVDIFLVSYTAVVSLAIAGTIFRYTRRWTILGTGVLLLSLALFTSSAASVMLYYGRMPYGIEGLRVIRDATRAILAIANTFILLGIIQDDLERRRQARESRQ